jgi:nitrite reductase (NO-forming)
MPSPKEAPLTALAHPAPAWPKSALRVSFGLIWLVDASLKWLPGFRAEYLATIQGAANGQPDWLQPWFRFWIAVQGHGPTMWAYVIALTETLMALAVVLGFARKLTYVAGAVFSLLIWSVPEGFGGPYVSGATDIGTAIVYAFVFLGLLALSAYGEPDPYAADHLLEHRIVWWWRVAEVRRPTSAEPDGVAPTTPRPTTAPAA